MSTGNELQPAAVDLLTKMQSKATERFELELNDLRATMMLIATCCEQSLTRLRDTRWISFDAASRLVTELSEAAEAERSRASQLSDDLEAVKRELECAYAEAARLRAAAELANRDVVAKLAQRAVLEQPRAGQSQPRPVEANRNHLAPQFEAIEAVLAGSPPIATWDRTA